NAVNKEFDPHDFTGIWEMTRLDHTLGTKPPPLTRAGIEAMKGRIGDTPGVPRPVADAARASTEVQLAGNGIRSNAPWLECNTMVVNTVGLDERAWLDNLGYPKSFHARLEETWKRVDYNTLELQLTLYDPEYYTAPYVGAKQTFKRVPDEDISYFGWKGLFAGISEGICAPMNEVEGYNKGFRDLGQAKPKQ